MTSHNSKLVVLGGENGELVSFEYDPEKSNSIVKSSIRKINMKYNCYLNNPSTEVKSITTYRVRYIAPHYILQSYGEDRNGGCFRLNVLDLRSVYSSPISDNKVCKSIELTSKNEKHDGNIWGLKFLPESNLIITGSNDKEVKLWRFDPYENDIESKFGNNSFVAKLGVHQDSVRDTCGYKRNSAFSCDNVGIVKFWDIENTKLIKDFRLSISTYTVCLENDDEKSCVFVGQNKGRLYIIDPRVSGVVYDGDMGRNRCHFQSWYNPLKSMLVVGFDNATLMVHDTRKLVSHKDSYYVQDALIDCNLHPNYFDSKSSLFVYSLSGSSDINTSKDFISLSLTCTGLFEIKGSKLKARGKMKKFNSSYGSTFNSDPYKFINKFSKQAKLDVDERVEYLREAHFEIGHSINFMVNLKNVNFDIGWLKCLLLL